MRLSEASVSRAGGSLLDADYHRSVAKLAVDAGILLTTPTLGYLAVSGSPKARLVAFAAVSILFLGTGVYLPAYFIGQELFDVGGYATLPFIYLFGFAITFSVLTTVLLAPLDAQLFIYFVLFVTATGGRIEIEGMPMF